MTTRAVLTKKGSTGEGLTIAGLARRSGLDVHVVRFYARIGLLQPAGISANGYRRFEAGDVTRLRFVRAAQRLGFTLAEAGEVLRRARRRESPCPLVRDIVLRRVAEKTREVGVMQTQLRRMRRALDVWHGMPDGTPTGHDICALVEAVADVDTTAELASVSRRGSRDA